MTDHPYRSQPARAFWSKVVAKDFSPTAVAGASGEPYLSADDRVVSAGSCFASNMIPWLEEAGLTYVRTEGTGHPVLDYLPENLGYRKFSAGYGNIYTARHFRQLIERAYGLYTPTEDRWYDGELVVDPFRPGLRYPARSDGEFDRLTQQHLAAVRAAVEEATVLVFTLGLTEAWESITDGAVYPTCPGTAGGVFDPEKYRFINFSVSDIRDDMLTAIRLIRRQNPQLRVILTVSPVPLVATATEEHVLVATTHSKAVLRVAASEIVASEPNIRYFPAYEIITGPQAPFDYYQPDRRDVTDAAVTAAMNAMFDNSALASDRTQPATPAPAKPAASAAALAATELSRRVSEAECDEVLADV